MGDKYEIISGVEDGDQVVITGQSRLTNGMEVENRKRITDYEFIWNSGKKSPYRPPLYLWRS